jgi:hypothetical protein
LPIASVGAAAFAQHIFLAIDLVGDFAKGGQWSRSTLELSGDGIQCAAEFVDSLLP